MAVAKDGFSARYNMTQKEVSDCECTITLRAHVCVHLCVQSVGLLTCFYSQLDFLSFTAFVSVISADTRLSLFIFFLFSFSSSPLTLSISSAVPALMLFQSRSAPSPLSAYFALS